MNREKITALTFITLVLSLSAILVSAWAAYEAQKAANEAHKQSALASLAWESSQAKVLMMSCDEGELVHPTRSQPLARDGEIVAVVTEPFEESQLRQRLPTITAAPPPSEENKTEMNKDQIPPTESPIPLINVESSSIEVALLSPTLPIEVHSMVCTLTNYGSQPLMEILSMADGYLDSDGQHQGGKQQIIFKIPGLLPNESKRIRFTNLAELSLEWKIPETIQVKTALNSKVSIEIPLLVQKRRIVVGGTPEEEKDVERKMFLWRATYPRPKVKSAR